MDDIDALQLDEEDPGLTLGQPTPQLKRPFASTACRPQQRTTSSSRLSRPPITSQDVNLLSLDSHSPSQSVSQPAKRRQTQAHARSTHTPVSRPPQPSSRPLASVWPASTSQHTSLRTTQAPPASQSLRTTQALPASQSHRPPHQRPPVSPVAAGCRVLESTAEVACAAGWGIQVHAARSIDAAADGERHLPRKAQKTCSDAKQADAVVGRRPSP